MTASKYCKLNGIESLAELGRIYNLSVGTLGNWWKYRNKVFKALVIALS